MTSARCWSAIISMAWATCGQPWMPMVSGTGGWTKRMFAYGAIEWIASASS